MKIGQIVKPNEKGQVVIPKEIREKLGIGKDSSLNLFTKGSAIFLYPVEEALPTGSAEQSYRKILEKTKGAWKVEAGTHVREQHKKKD